MATDTATTPSRDSGLSGESTVERLLRVAEELVAAHGRHGVSGRSITRAAGANVAAINYHFGSLDALVETVLQRRMGSLLTRREELMARCEATPRLCVDDVAAIVVVPLAELAVQPDGRAYAGFLRALLSAGPEERARVQGEFAPQFDRIDALFARVVPGAERQRCLRRFGWALDAVVAVLARPDVTVDEALVDELVQFTAGALLGGAGPSPTRGT